MLLQAWRGGWLQEAQSLGCVAVVCHFSLLDAASLSQLRAAGLRALSYTVNDDSVARQLVESGIDGMITDAVDRFSPASGGVSMLR